MNALGTRLVNTCESERALVTIRQVAQQAGVSVGTVSRVLNNKPGVSEKTRQHVLAVADELGYTVLRRFPLSTSTITHLGLLNRPIGEALPANPFYADVFHGVEQVCHEFHINLSYSSLDIVNGHLRSMPPLLNDERISGMVLMGAMARGVVESVADAAQLPVVLVDNCFGNCPWDAVMTANPRGAAMATEHLISRGHRHVALLGGPDHPSIVERRTGYEEALREHGLVPTVVESTGLDIADGERAVVDLLRQAPEMTAIMCSNDSQAIGALRELQGLGYRVPDDFSLVGFDDIPMAQLTSPPLTTVRVGRRALGQVAVQLLLGRIRALDRPAIKAIVGVTLVERASVGPPRVHSTRSMV
jgi:LacI family transcriptional regulator